MSHFVRNYQHLSFPVADDSTAGFRAAQIAALHALSAHFFGASDPAIVVMPTGSGKSAVLTAAPFVLRAKRVLVLTPSRLVREQLAENSASLVDLRKLEAMRSTAPSPQVCAVGRLVATPEEWEAFRPFDVVVATVPSVSPRPDAVATPPADLFDLVLVDEAHHSPARTWAALLKILAGARQVLFTATPFRRDEREIAGRIVFRYDIKRARDDGIFGEIGFQAVPRVAGENIDVTIAKAVAARFSADRLAGLKHLVMVRADTLQRAQELHDLYREHTTLRLEFVRGQHSLSHVRRILRKLDDEGQADGIVCVNMFGEGFNLPALKIAGIHSPHKSLAVTLQFIGRFARRAGRDIGTATFLAEPHESSLELGALYEAGATWRDLVANLSDSRVEEEVAAREVIDSFDVEASLGDLEDFSLLHIETVLPCEGLPHRRRCGLASNASISKSDGGCVLRRQRSARSSDLHYEDCCLPPVVHR